MNDCNALCRDICSNFEEVYRDLCSINADVQNISRTLGRSTECRIEDHLKQLRTTIDRLKKGNDELFVKDTPTSSVEELQPSHDLDVKEKELDLPSTSRELTLIDDNEQNMLHPMRQSDASLTSNGVQPATTASKIEKTRKVLFVQYHDASEQKKLTRQSFWREAEPICCKICCQSIAATTIVNHMRRKHNQEPDYYQCPYCKRQINEYQFDQHLKKVHREREKFGVKNKLM